MNNVEVLILHGSPGSGKSTLADALSEYFREADLTNIVIDPDELSRVYPPQDHSFSRRGLKAIWPVYSAVPNIKVIIPTVILDTEDLRLILDAIPAKRVMICELVAPEAVLKDRVSAREPNEYWQNRLRKWVDVYHQRDDSQKFGDFQVTTHDKSIEDTVKEIVEKAGWK
jgi:adenylate kinase family enzyme